MKTDKSLGQHWLTNIPSLEAMCEAGEVSAGDEVLEIGPGLGSLTELLLKRGANVTAVEFDNRLVENLTKIFDSKRFKLIQGDILNFDLGTMSPGYKVVANIPYYLTSKLLRNLLESVNKPALIALLIQKEVAERLIADPGQMSILSISAQFYAQLSAREIVPAKYFVPPPKVDSQIIQLIPRSLPLLNVDEPKFFRMVRAGFSEKRKKLINSLAGGLEIDKEEAKRVVTKCGMSDNIRAQELSLQQWDKLYDELYN